MRNAINLKLWVGFLAMVMGLAGCEEPALTRGFFDPRQADPQQADPQQVDPADALTAQAQANAQRVNGIAITPPATSPRDILWLNTTGEVYKSEKPTPPPAHQAYPPTPEVVAVKYTPDPPVATTPSTTPQTTETSDPADKLTRSQVYDQLINAVRNTDDSNLSKALAAATVGVINPHGEMDWSLLASLSPKDRELVERYHKTVSALRREVLMGDGKIDQSEVASRLSELFGQQPVSIRNIQLCEKVLGFGVYDAFPDNAFVAGREQKLIVYVELDNFQPTAQEEGDGYGSNSNRSLSSTNPTALRSGAMSRWSSPTSRGTNVVTSSSFSWSRCRLSLGLASTT